MHATSLMPLDIDTEPLPTPSLMSNCSWCGWWVEWWWGGDAQMNRMPRMQWLQPQPQQHPGPLPWAIACRVETGSNVEEDGNRKWRIMKNKEWWWIQRPWGWHQCHGKLFFFLFFGNWQGCQPSTTSQPWMTMRDGTGPTSMPMRSCLWDGSWVSVIGVTLCHTSPQGFFSLLYCYMFRQYSLTYMYMT